MNKMWRCFKICIIYFITGKSRIWKNISLFPNYVVQWKYTAKDISPWWTICSGLWDLANMEQEAGTWFWIESELNIIQSCKKSTVKLQCFLWRRMYLFRLIVKTRDQAISLFLWQASSIKSKEQSTSPQYLK